MAVDKCWGFDFAAPTGQSWTAGAQSTSQKRTGTHSMVLDGGGSKSPSFGNQGTMYMGAACYWTYLINKMIIAYYDGSNAQVSVTVETDGALKVRRGDHTGTVLASSSTGIFTANTWHHLQLKAVFHGSSGSVELRLNSVTVASASGINTSNSGNAYASQILCNAPDGISTGYADDVWISDSTFRGDSKVETLYPSADGTTNNFTASAGSRYQCVDETPHNGDTDYVSSSTLNDIQLFAMGNLASTTGTVPLVQVHNVSRKDDAGARSVAPVIRSGGSNAIGTDVSQTTSYMINTQAYTQDPTDSAAWTISKVNAMEAGVKITV